MLNKKDTAMLSNSKDNTEVALFIVRLVLGSTLLLHGSQKVFGIFGGQNAEAFAQWLFSSFKVPLWLGYSAAYLEFITGVMITLGIATEFAAAAAIPFLIGAIYLVHLPHGYFMQNKGFEYPFNLMLLAIALCIGRPRLWSIWNWNSTTTQITKSLYSDKQ